MKSLRSLIDWLPYYFKDNDTYKVNGKGLFERYLDIFGEYFDDTVVGDINTLDDIIDVDNTPDLYLGYLWEFMGAMPYANPKAINPEKWKAIFNGFYDSTTIERLKEYWIYPTNTFRNSTSDHFDLTDYQVRALVKYSVALFSIRGTSKFFKVLLSLYGFDVTIGDYHKTPNINQYLDTFNDTKLDTIYVQLDKNCQLDNHEVCTKCTTVDFKLSPFNPEASGTYKYTIGTNEFERLYHRMYNLIDLFLPIGVRPHIIFKYVIGSDSEVIEEYDPKVTRYCDVYVDKDSINDDDSHLMPSDYDGWYLIQDDGSHNLSSITNLFDTKTPIRIMVKVIDDISTGVHVASGVIQPPQPKTFKVDFGDGYSEDFEDGHIFTLAPSDKDVTPKFTPTAINEDEYNIVSITTFKFSWDYIFDYDLFNWYNSSVNTELSNSNNSINIVIQSAIVRTRTNDVDITDDEFFAQGVLNVTTGNILQIQDSENCTYIDTLVEPGIYTYRMINKPEHTLNVEVTIVDEVLTVVETDSQTSGQITTSDPSVQIRIKATSNISSLKVGKETRSYSYGVTGSNPNVFGPLVGPKQNKPYYTISIDFTDINLSRDYNVVFLRKPVHDYSQYVVISWVYQEHNYSVRINLLHGSITILDSYDDNYLTGVLNDHITIHDPVDNSCISDNHSITYSEWYSIRTITIDDSLINYNLLIESLYDPDILIKETTNPVTKYWNNGEVIILDDPGHYRFYAESLTYKSSSNFTDYSLLSQKYNVGYYLELFDGDKSDDEEYMLRTKSSYLSSYTEEIEVDGDTQSVEYNMYGAKVYFKVGTNIDKATGINIENLDPGGLDFEINIYRGSVPIQENFQTSLTADKLFIEGILPEDPNNYSKYGVIELRYNRGIYTIELPTRMDWSTWNSDHKGNLPPGTYCIELHANNRVLKGRPTYLVFDLYEVPEQVDRSLYFDIDIISNAWTTPAGQYYDTDPITGKKTWGWYKTNPDQAYSVRIASYDPGIDIPIFRLVVTNNDLKYRNVYMYKLVTGNWDPIEVDTEHYNNYPQVDTTPVSEGGHWLPEIGDSWLPDSDSKYVFTGSIYNIGEPIQGPIEPGKYLFLINQLDNSIDTKSINYAYLEVKEQIKYSLIINPMAAIIGDHDILVDISVESSAKYTNEKLYIIIENPRHSSTDYISLPYTYNAYSVGAYIVKLYRYVNHNFEPVLDTDGNIINGTFIILSDNGISNEYLEWAWDNIGDKRLDIVTVSNQVEWSIEIQDQS